MLGQLACERVSDRTNVMEATVLWDDVGNQATVFLAVFVSYNNGVIKIPVLSNAASISPSSIRYPRTFT